MTNLKAASLKTKCLCFPCSPKSLVITLETVLLPSLRCERRGKNNFSFLIRGITLEVESESRKARFQVSCLSFSALKKKKKKKV